VFQQFKLPRGTWKVRNPQGKLELVRPQDIKTTALLTVEGELDDISGHGQTEAAHGLCSSIAKNQRLHLEIAGAGHYGIFSGSKWRQQIYPQVREFILAAENKTLNTKGSVHRAYQTYIECTPFLTDEEQYACELEANDSPVEPQVEISSAAAQTAVQPATKTKAAQAGFTAKTAEKPLKTARVAAPQTRPKAAAPKAAPKAAAKAAAPKAAKKPVASAGKNKPAKPAFPSLPPRAA
jgi:poly(3-hydroxybutyrate) depolymerase